MSPRWSLVLAAALAALVGPAVVSPPASGAESKVVTTREVIGTSVSGRPIVAVHRTRAVPEGTVIDPAALRTVLVIGSIHGDEQAGMRVVRRLRQRETLPADLDLWLVPTVNPDGTADYRRTNAHGVDLNRNFPFRWRNSSPGPTWSGPRWLSEPESLALRALHKRLEPALTLTFHQPLFGVGANDKAMPTVRALAREMKLPVDEFLCTGVCYGTFTGWINNRTDGLGVTVEFGRRVPAWRVSRAERAIVTVGSRLVR